MAFWMARSLSPCLFQLFLCHVISFSWRVINSSVRPSILPKSSVHFSDVMKGADGGIDGIAYFRVGRKDNAKIIFQVKSGGVSRKDIATLRGDMQRTDAALGVLITLEAASKPMVAEAKAAGQYRHEDMGRSYDRITIVTAQEMVESFRRLEIPMSIEVLKAAQKEIQEQQLSLL